MGKCQSSPNLTMEVAQVLVTSTEKNARSVVLHGYINPYHSCDITIFVDFAIHISIYEALEH